MIAKIFLPVCVAALSALLSANGHADGATRPNVLVLFSDDHQDAAVRAMGCDEIITPHLDQLAKQGVVFRNAHAEIPTCQPSRASILTGCSAFTHGVMHPRYTESFRRPLAPNSWTEVFRQAGYRTFWTGKWNTWGSPSDFGVSETSRVFKGGMGSHQLSFDEGGEVVRGFSSTLFADAAIRFLRSTSGDDRPFFATVAFTAPHDPRTPPAEYRALYPDGEVSLPPAYLAEHPFDDGYFGIRDEKLLPRPRTKGAVRGEIAAYYGMITQMDAQIGRILQALRDAGKTDNTIVIYLGDHGLAVGNHGLLGKMSMYSHSVRTPLIIAGPGVPQGGVRDALVYLYDLFPTTAAMVGVEVPESVEGVDFSEVIRGEKADAREFIYGANANLQRMVRDARYKLVRYYRDEARGIGSDRYVFFDLKEDPNELRNLVDEGEHQERIAAFKRYLRDWQVRVADPYRGRE
ncbi:sulfatase-like hydrolase/transferase [Sulfuriroseicoccus oceanibius]|uniref:Sulfatase-like hydrolase/transferase n=1 Tax=Sulfuriroseicoccus oceanibius TaxID=2707525 RepID=A0A6B3L365_9BACT|nr:sulfatase-like hydrolase/transferase [Sulfuriroseicoccus oceanibius]QQL44173.1 sulfatase-like hydrolase/transferase [Sulfuriroseicoccus oceanibius]